MCFAPAAQSWVSWVSWVSWPGTKHAQRASRLTSHLPVRKECRFQRAVRPQGIAIFQWAARTPKTPRKW